MHRTTNVIQFTSIPSPTAANPALDDATSPDTFIGLGEVALTIVEGVAISRLRSAARALGEGKSRAAPNAPGGGKCGRHW